MNKIAEMIVKIINKSDEPLETKEVEIFLKSVQKRVTRTIVMARLRDLRGEGYVKGKSVGSGKGVWIWWKSRRKR